MKIVCTKEEALKLVRNCERGVVNDCEGCRTCILVDWCNANETIDNIVEIETGK